MGLGQTMLTTLFLVLLTLAVISANRLIFNSESSFYEQEAYKEAGLLANALLQEIVRKKFDSTVDTSDSEYKSTSSFDWSLGPSNNARTYVNPGGAADIFPYKSIKGSNGDYFDDIDDYKGYKRVAYSGNMVETLTVDVYYVKQNGTRPIPLSKQYFKRIDVNVFNIHYLRDTLVFSTIVAY